MALGNVEYRDARVLDFDIENRPLAYLGMDYTTGEITAIAAGWLDEDAVHVWALGDVEMEAILTGFLELYEQADIVTGHYIRRHDLPVISAALAENGLGSLPPKLTVDTKEDLEKWRHLSKSQENLSEMLGLPAPKVQMNQPKWRAANRLTPEGIELTKKRVVGDIAQHKLLYKKLTEERRLSNPQIWKPTR